MHGPSIRKAKRGALLLPRERHLPPYPKRDHVRGRRRPSAPRPAGGSRRGALGLRRGSDSKMGRQGALRSRVLVARISELNVECSFVPGSGLEGMLCDCHAPRVCLHRVVAVLAWQIEHGVTEPPTLATHALLASSEAPRTRDEVRASVIAVTEELVAHGLSTLNPAMIGRLRIGRA